MISYCEAKKLTLELAKTLSVVDLPILEALDHVFSEDIISEVNIPPFNNSAMDGYAVRWSDISTTTLENPTVLEMIGEVPAGGLFHGKVLGGQAVAIFTGAPIPEGADTVVQIELTKKEDNRVLIFKSVENGANIRLAGEDVKAGDTVFTAGTRITPGVVGVLASIGRSRIRVYRKPVVGVISTGSELLEIDEPYEHGKIRNSNTYLLRALLKELPVQTFNFGFIEDDPEIVKRAFEKALSTVDVLITTGGVSVGEYDPVKRVLEEMGAELIFWKVAQKPGKPMALYRWHDRVIFGLPGNPAAVHICFLEYVRPFILKSLGYKNFEPATVKARIEGGHRKKSGRLNFIRVFLAEKEGRLVATKTGAQGSGVLSTSARANALALIPEEVDNLQEDEEVEIHYFDSLSLSNSMEG